MNRNFIRSLFASFLIASASAAGYAQQLNYTGKVNPTPQRVIGQWELLPVTINNFEVVVSENAHNAVKLGKEMLIERVKGFKGGGDSKNAGALMVILGELKDENIRNALEKYNVKLDESIIPAGNKQGYFIRVFKSGDASVVIAAGNGHRGTFYAAMTLLQSIGIENGRLILRCADINDWPVWKERYFCDQTLPTQEQLLTCLARNKIDGFAFQFRGEWRGFTERFRFDKTDNGVKNRKAMAELKAFKDRYDLIDYIFTIHIYAADRREYPMLDITNEKDVKGLIERCRQAAGFGFNHIMIMADDWTPTQKGDYVCPHETEKKQFDNSIGKAHGYLMKKIYEALKPQYPNLSLAFCPAPYSIYDHDVPGRVSHQKYLKDMAAEMPDDIYVVWTGPKIVSSSVTKEDYELYAKKYVKNQKSYLWDNSNCFAPVARWETKLYDGFEKDSDGIIFINDFVFTWPWHIPFALNTNDYLWNPKGYDAVASYRDVIEKIFGKGSYEPVGRYIDIYKALQAGDKKADFRDIEKALSEMKNFKMDIRYPAKAVEQLKAKFNAKVPAIKAKYAEKPPVLDGKLDDSCWGQAESFELSNWDKGKTVNHSGSGKVCHDEKNLYIAFRLEHAKPLKKSIISIHDAPIFAGSDVCEIFLEGEKPGGYAHLSFDHAGNLHDETPVQNLGLAWDPDWTVAVNEGDGVWTAEVKIPFKSMMPVIETPVGRGTIWRANFCRSNTPEGELSCWSPTYGNRFNTASFFGRLIFE